MRKRITRYFLCAFLCFSAALNLSADEEIQLATGEWPPYVSEALENFGIISEIVTAVVHEMGMKPKYRFYPWSRAEKLTKEGVVFAAFPYAKNDLREQVFDFSDAIYTSKTVFFYYKPNMNKISYEKLEELKPYKIGGARGNSYMRLLESAGLDIQQVNDQEQLVRLLKRGRVDLIPLDKEGGRIILKALYPKLYQNFGALDQRVGIDEKKDASHLLVSRHYPNAKELTQGFNEALLRIKEKGIYQKIIDKYESQSQSQ